MTHKQTTAMSMTTTPNTNTNTVNTRANAPVAAAVDDCDCCTAYAMSADLCAPYIITLEEARKERQEEESNKQRREKWDYHLQYAQHRAHKRGRLALKEETDTVKAAAMYARLSSTWASYFMPDEETEVTRFAQLVGECLDDVRERAQQRGWAPLAQHWKCLPEGILASAAMQPYLRRWAAADDDAADAAAAVAAAVAAALEAAAVGTAAVEEAATIVPYWWAVWWCSAFLSLIKNRDQRILAFFSRALGCPVFKER
jgi:hypothetical protein